MAYKNNVYLSNRAHARLRRRAADNLGKDRLATKKYEYHDRVERIQNVKNKVLSKAEREKIYKKS